MYTRRQFAAQGISVLLSVSPSRAQEPEAAFSSRIDVVNLLATVRDKKGQIIRDLGKDDFSILEDGRSQTVRYFSRETDLPLTIGLMVDTSMSQEKVLDAERGASFRFLDQVLRENKDRVFIMQFDLAVQVRQPLTSSRRELSDALAFVNTPTRRQLMVQFGGGTLLYDAITDASGDIMKAQSGRKALIVLSDGVDNGSDASLTDAIEAAHRGGSLIYSILFSDAGFFSGGRDGKSVLMRLSRETGGGFFAVSKKLPIDQVFALIQEDLRSQYSLGYVSDRRVTEGEFRRVQVAIRRPGLVVQSRDRYWAEP